MFRFKDSNFYLNQVCVPNAKCEDALYDGMLVDVDFGEPCYADKNLTDGKYIVIGEALNRPVVASNPEGYAILHDVHPADSYVRVYELEKLKGVEFVTDQIAIPVVGTDYHVDATGKFVAGSGKLHCVEARPGYAVLMYCEFGHAE